MIYSQMFNLLCEKSDDVYGGRLSVYVRCLIDEAANIGQIVTGRQLSSLPEDSTERGMGCTAECEEDVWFAGLIHLPENNV